MGINLQNLPGFVAYLDTVPVLHDRWGGRAQVLRGVRISGWGTGSLFPVVLCDGLEILKGLALGKDAKFEFVACYVEKGVFWAEDLAKEGMIELVNPRPGDAHEGEFYREKGYRDLHIPSGGERGGGGGRGRRRVYLSLRNGTD